MTPLIFIALLVGVRGARAPKGDTELPAVASMMNASAHTLGRISKHVEKIGSHMSELIAQQKKELAEQKAEYEQKLEDESSENVKLEGQNEKESTAIWELEKSNDDLRAQAKKLQKENANLRKAFNTVQAKVDAVNKFSRKVLDSTDDEGNSDLAVLNQKEGKEKESDEDSEQEGEEKKDEMTDSDSKEEDTAPAKDSEDDHEASAKDSDPEQDSQDSELAPNVTVTQDLDGDTEAQQSFLAITSTIKRTRRARRDDDDGDNPEEEQASSEEVSSDSSSEDASQATDATQNTTQGATEDAGSEEMVRELTKEITQLSKQQDSSRADLSNLFQARFKKGADRKAQILAKQELLNSTKTSLTKLHIELQSAVKHLQGTKAKLENQLHGLGRYLAQLATYVTEPAADAEKALPSLPKDVQTFLQEKN